ncbi:hypothetical protein CC79DRAFT_1327848 [Sarocladium strictum]
MLQRPHRVIPLNESSTWGRGDDDSTVPTMTSSQTVLGSWLLMTIQAQFILAAAMSVPRWMLACWKRLDR